MADDGYTGQQSPTDASSEFNATVFVVKQLLNRISTSTLVVVKKCTKNDELGPVGFVDVVPLVNLIDREGKTQEHGIVHNLCYFRLQSGKNAIIMDPKEGDIGVAVFADRDISSVKANKKASPPGSFRRFDMADGIYLGAVLGDTPVQFIRFFDHAITIEDENENKIEMSTSGIVITDKNTNKVEMTTNGLKLTDKFGHFIDMKSSGIDISGNVTSTGTFQNNGVNIGSTHHHTDPQGGTTGGPS